MNIYETVCNIHEALRAFFDHKFYTYNTVSHEYKSKDVTETIIRQWQGTNVTGVYRFGNTCGGYTMHTLTLIPANKSIVGEDWKKFNGGLEITKEDAKYPLLYLAVIYSNLMDSPIPEHYIAALQRHPWIKKWCSKSAIDIWLRNSNIPLPQLNPGNIILLVGASGSGKSSVEARCNELGMKSVVSYTTRPKRSEDEKGHIFLDKFVLEKGIDMAGGIDVFKEDCVAYTYFDNHHYYATQEQADEADIYVIDPAGVKWFRDHYKGEKTPIVIYLSAWEVTRYARITASRGEEEAKRRIAHDRKSFGIKELAKMAPYYILENNRTNPETINDIADKIFNIWRGEEIECTRKEIEGDPQDTLE